MSDVGKSFLNDVRRDDKRNENAAQPGQLESNNVHDQQAQSPGSTTRSWRDVYAVHPAANILPMLSHEKLRELGEDIKECGLRERIVVWEASGEGNTAYLLDGRNRLEAMEQLGIAIDERDLIHLSERDTDPYRYVCSKNIQRRHLGPKEAVEFAAEIRGLWNSDRKQESGKSFPLSPPTGRGNEGVTAKIAKDTGLSKPTARKHLRKIANKKVEQGKLTEADVQQIMPKKLPSKEQSSESKPQISKKNSAAQLVADSKIDIAKVKAKSRHERLEEARSIVQSLKTEILESRDGLSENPEKVIELDDCLKSLENLDAVFDSVRFPF